MDTEKIMNLAVSNAIDALKNLDDSRRKEPTRIKEDIIHASVSEDRHLRVGLPRRLVEQSQDADGLMKIEFSILSKVEFAPNRADEFLVGSVGPRMLHSDCCYQIYNNTLRILLPFGLDTFSKVSLELEL